MRSGQQLIYQDIDKSYVSQRLVAKEFKLGALSLKETCEAFLEWSFDDMDMIWRKEHVLSHEVIYESALLAKRGNAKYEWRVKEHLQPLMNAVKEFGYDIFEDDDDSILNAATSKAWTNLLWVTLTIDHTVCKWNDAWLQISKWFNDFKRDFQRKFNTRVDVARVWEPQENGYPHVHCLIYCHDVYFKVFKWLSKNEYGGYDITFRVQDRRFHSNIDFKGHDWNDPTIPVRMNGRTGELVGHRGIWPYGTFDVQGVKNTHEKVAYLFKYVFKTVADLRAVQGQEDFGKVALTMACMWAANKRAYAANPQFWYSILTGHRIPKGRVDQIGQLIFDYSAKLRVVEQQQSTVEVDVFGNPRIVLKPVFVEETVYRLELLTHNSANEKRATDGVFNVVPITPIRHAAAFDACRSKEKDISDFTYTDISLLYLDQHSLAVMRHSANGELVEFDLAVLRGEEQRPLPVGYIDDSERLRREILAKNERRLQGWPDL